MSATVSLISTLILMKTTATTFNIYFWTGYYPYRESYYSPEFLSTMAAPMLMALLSATYCLVSFANDQSKVAIIFAIAPLGAMLVAIDLFVAHSGAGFLIIWLFGGTRGM